jgi:hypothetical protein
MHGATPVALSRDQKEHSELLTKAPRKSWTDVHDAGPAWLPSSPPAASTLVRHEAGLELEAKESTTSLVRYSSCLIRESSCLPCLESFFLRANRGYFLCQDFSALNWLAPSYFMIHRQR